MTVAALYNRRDSKARRRHSAVADCRSSFVKSQLLCPAGNICLVPQLPALSAAAPSAFSLVRLAALWSSLPMRKVRLRRDRERLDREHEKVSSVSEKSFSHSKKMI
jgi:hypothetical protein